jgi:hypothetical protein
MRKSIYLMLVLFFACVLTFPISSVVAKEPSGAKAIFDSGEGPSVKMSVGAKPTPVEPAKVEKKEKFIGVSYQLMLLKDDGQLKVVPKSRIFKSGEKIKLLIRSNKPGYMTILNVGPSGNTNVLFNEYVEALKMHEIPRNTNFKFVGSPGTEKILIMLSNEPNQIVNQPTVASTISSIEGAKDIVVEDEMKSSFAVVSPKNNWKPVSGGKDIVLESDQGTNYGVIPVSTLAEGGVLTLTINLKHK